MMSQTEEILQFWLVDTPAEGRFVQDRALDAEIRRRFGTLHEQLSGGVPVQWRSSPRDLLAAVIVLDQFSRNLFRGSPQAYAQDAQARALVEQALEKGWDRQLSVEERWFLYMPFMHSEDLADQERSVALYKALGLEEVFDFAMRHRDQIARFGRFPQRNEVLGRESTADEKAFLQRPDSRF